jgi:hypothetical protein
MSTIAHSILFDTVRFAARAKRLAVRSVRAVMEARMRRIQYELQFQRSFDAYRERKGIPALNGDLRSGS